MSVDQKQKIKSDDLEPDLFRAAQEDDVKGLELALEQGQSLDMKNPGFLNMTPIHLACVFRSNAFLKAAADSAEFDPWIRDDNGRLAFDHAAAGNNKEAMSLLMPKLYPDAPGLK